MATMRPCERVGLDFLGTAPHRFRNSVELDVSPDQLWDVLTDAAAWPEWASVITRVTWTSPEPHGVGTTRTVAMRGGLVGEEEFLAWEPGRRMAFRFNAASTSAVRAFAELYEIEPTPAGCRLTWTLAQEVGGPSRFTMPLGRPLLDIGFRRFLGNLQRYTARRFATA
ncbi:SRPBCC family protein [Nocardioides panacisoli]|uniref:SRPBCC family protein n=1 Tax=Nocardioides panacisoli TaxID=627624 RepID=UPI001C635B2B|nr:SRPBCC family protein [Nocardioides panacisoli]QYJ04990.1 SRPBCC family protein [Nocardioides panacisoli]